MKALFHGRQKVVGNRAADDRIDPQEVVLFVVVEFPHVREAVLGAELLDLGVFGEREHANVHFAELAAAARLLLVAIASLGLVLDRFAIGNFRLVHFDFHFVAALEPFAQNHQVQLAHAVHHQFFGLRVAVEVERGVFFDDLVQRAGKLGFVAAGLGHGGQADHRRGELDRRHHPVRPASCRCADLRSWQWRRCRRPRPIRSALRFARLHLQQRPSLIFFFTPETCTLSSFLIVPL